MLCLKKIRGSDSSREVEDDGAEDEISIERILAAGLSRGLTKQDADEMTLGMWIDYIIEWNNMNSQESDADERSVKGPKPKADKRRRATQADFDNF